MFKIQLDKVLSNLFELTLLWARGVDKEISKHGKIKESHVAGYEHVQGWLCRFSTVLVELSKCTLGNEAAQNSHQKINESIDFTVKLGVRGPAETFADMTPKPCCAAAAKRDGNNNIHMAEGQST